MAHALIVEDDADAARLVAGVAADQGFTAACAGTLLDARRQLALQAPDLLLLDLRLPDGDGLDLLGDPELLGQPAVVLMTGHPALPSALRAWREGALDYLVKPFTGEQLRAALARRLVRGGASGEPETGGAKEKAPAATRTRLGLLVGASAPMQAVYREIERVAPTPLTVMITGESGTGKELVARTLHDLSPRRARAFVAVNCGALSPNLAESELFGHERGSFTGADRQHLGLFEQAAGGTLFLDEITEMPLAMQVKLLRVLESGQFMRVGATGQQSADVRLIAASNRDPARAVAEGLLREDLFWRLDVFPINLPPLRERREDLGLLAAHLIAPLGPRSAGSSGPPALNAKALARLAAHDWPGNVRELRNVIKRAWIMGEGPALDAAQLEAALRRPARTAPSGKTSGAPSSPAAVEPPGPRLSLPLGLSLAEAERLLIEATLAHHGARREQAAATLGISLKTLYNRLCRYGLA